MRQSVNKYKYMLAFVITLIIFGVIFYINSVIENQRVNDVKNIQDQISLDILSSETQFDLLKDASCKNVDESTLTQEINSLASKLSDLESTDQNQPSDELTYLKKYYSLLQIKDFILMQQLGTKCASKPITVLYFYGTKSDCPDCENMGYVLTYLRQNYPELRIYSFDTNLDLSALDTLKSIYKISPNKLPAIVYDDDSYIGFKSIDEMKNIIPDLKKIDAANAAAAAASSTASSTSANNAQGSPSITSN